ncbi:MAG: DUF177 domain-containing protein [Firmicutes bacterium]|nr:DUF177 domain-containing protein [Bacillota bacterium]
MLIDLSSLKEVGSCKSIDRKIELPDLSYREQEIVIPFPLDLKLDMYNTEDSYTLTGSLAGNLVLTCSRCLERFEYKIDIKINEELMKDEINNISEFDISSILIEHILLIIPIKPICSQDCKGLCVQCGQNLNEGECDCEKDIIDPRMAKLKKLFDDKDNEEV